MDAVSVDLGETIHLTDGWGKKAVKRFVCLFVNKGLPLVIKKINEWHGKTNSYTCAFSFY